VLSAPPLLPSLPVEGCSALSELSELPCPAPCSSGWVVEPLSDLVLLELELELPVPFGEPIPAASSFSASFSASGSASAAWWTCSASFCAPASQASPALPAPADSVEGSWVDPEPVPLPAEPSDEPEPEPVDELEESELLEESLLEESLPDEPLPDEPLLVVSVGVDDVESDSEESGPDEPDESGRPPPGLVRSPSWSSLSRSAGSAPSFSSLSRSSAPRIEVRRSPAPGSGLAPRACISSPTSWIATRAFSRSSADPPLPLLLDVELDELSELPEPESIPEESSEVLSGESVLGSVEVSEALLVVSPLSPLSSESLVGGSSGPVELPVSGWAAVSPEDVLLGSGVGVGSAADDVGAPGAAGAAGAGAAGTGAGLCGAGRAAGAAAAAGAVVASAWLTQVLGSGGSA